MDRGVVAILLVLLLMAPLTGSIAEGDSYDYDSNDDYDNTGHIFVK